MYTVKSVGEETILIHFLHYHFHMQPFPGIFNTFCGCDTTSTLFGYEKIQLRILIKKEPDFELAFYLEPSATTNQVAKSGENPLIHVYGVSSCSKSEGLRLLYLCKINSKSTDQPSTEMGKMDKKLT